MPGESSRQQVAFSYVQSRVRIYKPVLLALAFLVSASAQTYVWDNSGNGLLKGTYYFRHVAWLVGANDGSLGDGVAIYGNITFDGNGNYTTSAQIFDINAGVGNYNFSGTYRIAANGYGFIDNLLVDGDSVYGLVANGIFIGSSTENAGAYSDMLIAAPLASPLPGLSNLRGNYTLVAFDMPGTYAPTEARDMVITFSADGNGNLSNLVAQGYMGYAGTNPFRQSIGSQKYLASNGGFNLHFGGSFTIGNIDSTLIVGDHYLYMSPDGNFVFGGSPQGIDMMVGVRSPSAASSFAGLYYHAGMDELIDPSSGAGVTDNYFGSFKSLGNNLLLEHVRYLNTNLSYSTGVTDINQQDTVTANTDGTMDDSLYHEYFLGDGSIRIGVGKPPVLGINVALRAPTFTSPSSAPYIDPTGISNTASSALFTTGVTAGELVTIYGSNLAPHSMQDATFPTMLDGVQVQVNGIYAPILSVNQCGPYPCVTFMVPYEVSGTLVQIQLFNNGVASNIVTAWLSIQVNGGVASPGTALGIFTFPAGGLGLAAAQHTSDFSLITPDNPARPGELIALYLTGIGPVTPAVASGAPGPNPLANANAAISVYIGNALGSSTFTGLVPGVIGLAQINVTVPATGLSGGKACGASTCYVLEVSSVDSDALEAMIPVSSSSAGGRAVTAAARSVPRQRRATELRVTPSNRSIRIRTN